MDFVTHLYQAANHVVGEPDTSEISVKQLAFENANKVGQEVIQPHPKKGTISVYNHLCTNRRQAHLQGLTMAAALKQIL